MTTTLKGFKKTRHGFIPNTWSYSTLADATSLLKDGTHFSPQSKEGPFRYITSKNIRFGTLALSNCSYISEEDHSRIFAACPVRKGDVLLTKDGANTGNAALNTLDEPISLLSSVAVLRGNQNVLANNFLLQFILSPRGQYSFISEMAGQAITRLTLTTIGQIEVPLPPLPEQRKIAAVLSTWDRAIELTENLIAAKQKRKQALMQQFLTGKVGSPVKLSSVVKRVNDPITPDLNSLYREIGIRSHGKGIFHKEPVTGKSLGDKRVYRIHPDCFVFNVVFAWEQAIAKTTSSEMGMIASHRFPMYLPLDGKIDLDYMLYFFKTERGKHLLGLASPGGAGRNRTLSQSGFLKTKIPLPPIAEQRTFSTLLSTADSEIDLLRRRLSAIKLQKRGLMQQLLTGKIRVVPTESEVCHAKC